MLRWRQRCARVDIKGTDDDIVRVGVVGNGSNLGKFGNYQSKWVIESEKPERLMNEYGSGLKN